MKILKTSMAIKDDLAATFRANKSSKRLRRHHLGLGLVNLLGLDARLVRVSNKRV
jgi:hypothetical protein